MKAVILEKKDGYAAALKDDGTIVRMRDNNYTIGDVIMMKDKKPLFNKKWGTLVAALLIFAMVGTTTMVNAAPYHDVFVEFEQEEYRIEVSKSGSVLGVYEISGEKQELMDEPEFKEMSVKEVIADLIGERNLDDLVDLDLIITVASKNEKNAEKFAQKLMEKEAVDDEDDDEEEMGEKPEKDEIPGNVDAITNDMVKEAKEEGIAPGKLNIINKLVPERGDIIEFGEENLDRDDLIGLAKDNPKDLMKIFSESRGNKDGEKLPPGQEKKIEATQNENREENREEIEEENTLENNVNNGNKGGKGKGNN